MDIRIVNNIPGGFNGIRNEPNIRIILVRLCYHCGWLTETNLILISALAFLLTCLNFNGDTSPQYYLRRGQRRGQSRGQGHDYGCSLGNDSGRELGLWFGGFIQ